MTSKIDELKLKRNELRVKIIGIVLTMATIIFSLFQYFHKLSNENSMEFKRNIWKKQIEVYTQACKYAGLIAVNPNGEGSKENIKSFQALYWGEIIMFEDTKVEEAMKEFYLTILDYNPKDKKSEEKLKFKANELAKTCRESTKKTWKELK